MSQDTHEPIKADGNGKLERDFLILGHARSGTGYMAALFKALGFDVGHEQMGQHGVSAWMYAADDDHYPYTQLPPRRDVSFKHVIHVVREPLATINSVYNTDQKQAPAVNFRRKHLGRHRIEDDRLLGTIQSIVMWNRFIENQEPDFEVQVEKAANQIPSFLEREGYEVPAQVNWPKRNVNTRPRMGWRIWTWNGLRNRLPPDVYLDLEGHRIRYGYLHF